MKLKLILITLMAFLMSAFSFSQSLNIAYDGKKGSIVFPVKVDTLHDVFGVDLDLVALPGVIPSNQTEFSLAGAVMWQKRMGPNSNLYLDLGLGGGAIFNEDMSFKNVRGVVIFGFTIKN